MTWKAGIIAGGIILILLAGSNFVNYKISYKAGYSAAVATLTQDSTVVTTDTVWAKAIPKIVVNKSLMFDIIIPSFCY